MYFDLKAIQNINAVIIKYKEIIYKPPTNPISSVDIVNIKPKRADFEDIGEKIVAHTNANERGLPMYLGTPLSMEKYFSFPNYRYIQRKCDVYQ